MKNYLCALKIMVLTMMFESNAMAGGIPVTMISSISCEQKVKKEDYPNLSWLQGYSVRFEFRSSSDRSYFTSFLQIHDANGGVLGEYSGIYHYCDNVTPNDKFQLTDCMELDSSGGYVQGFSFSWDPRWRFNIIAEAQGANALIHRPLYPSFPYGEWLFAHNFSNCVIK